MVPFAHRDANSLALRYTFWQVECVSFLCITHGWMHAHRAPTNHLQVFYICDVLPTTHTNLFLFSNSTGYELLFASCVHKLCKRQEGKLGNISRNIYVSLHRVIGRDMKGDLFWSANTTKHGYLTTALEQNKSKMFWEMQRIHGPFSALVNFERKAWAAVQVRSSDKILDIFRLTYRDTLERRAVTWVSPQTETIPRNMSPRVQYTLYSTVQYTYILIHIYIYSYIKVPRGFAAVAETFDDPDECCKSNVIINWQQVWPPFFF